MMSEKLGAAGREPTRAGEAPIAVRVVGLSLVTVFIVQAAVESRQWLNGNEASRRIYLLVIAVVVCLLTMTTLRLAARSWDFARITLTAGASGGLTAATLWLAMASLSTRMPRDSAGGVVLVAAFSALAAGLVAYRTRGPRDICAAGLLAATIGTSLVFAMAEGTIQGFPGRIPDIVGPVMPGGSTAAQLLRENRIEIVDGYVGLLLVLAALLVALLLVSRPRRPGHSGGGPETAQH
jgi:uncharacterized membrane protein